MSSSGIKRTIPTREILKATEGFANQIPGGGGVYARVYYAKLGEQWQNQTAAVKRFIQGVHKVKEEFNNELEVVSRLHHENIIGFIGYNDQYNSMMLVYEYAVNRSLYDHLVDPMKRIWLTWGIRLNICIDAAKGLNYLHSGLGKNKRVIHRSVNPTHILLGEYMVAKISGFRLSQSGPRNKVDDTPVETTVDLGDKYYLDPIYNESRIPTTKSDVYSFGVLLIEMVTGKLAKDTITGFGPPQTLIDWIRSNYDDGLDKIVDYHIKDQIKIDSFHEFKELAYGCISLNSNDRPTMHQVMKRLQEAQNIQIHGPTFTKITKRSHKYEQLESWLIPLKEIKLATGNFNPITQIGEGGFGNVYKAQLSERWENCTVAIKRLDPKSHQGKKEFLTEIKLISSFHHQNIIPFVGYCDEEKEMIIVYEYANNGSLDHHLHDPIKRGLITWSQRLKICLGAANGLEYLHSGQGDFTRVIHRDIKCGNILLDENMHAKICDFGLSKEGPRNQQHTQIYTKASGTNFYLDPLYQESGILRKESDVYSFGVVLFEILSGRPAYKPTKFVDGNPQFLINLVRRYYNDEPEKLIDPAIKNQVDSRCFNMFKDLAYQCISLESEERPTMETIIDTLEDAIDFQDENKNDVEKATFGCCCLQ
ncbi:cysteine-rich receptor-like protein kinase 43 [Lactuca sativa]|uniref:Protein kinase domain-containing protein n=1 Tax=Lactuca sativa TaxID=4236 RepID=A0A9R1WJI1_LACSA|nr:cysteine-rich receptor-like protein kinase 43 [Lactuca sativa]KAJ0225163.1 hypothetical protein LSAT_V11C100033790 [Lactuca sativa]